MVSESMERLGRKKSVIREIFEYSKSRKAEIGEENVFDFSIGNPSIDPPPEVRRALIELVTETSPTTLHGYTSAQGDPGVRAAVAEYVRRTFDFDADPSLIYLTSGAAAALTVTLNALLPDKEHGEVIALAPYFPEYKVFVEKAGGTLVSVPCRADDLQIDVKRVRAAITEKTRAVIVNSPCNPTGVIFSLEVLNELAAALRESEEMYGHPIYIISDEPYRELVYDGACVPYIPSIYKNTIVCYSFSKSLSIPGERIGYILVSPEACEAHRVYSAVLGAGRALGFVCANSLFQYLIPRCLGLVSDLSVYSRNRDRLYSALDGLGFECVRPMGAFYLFVKSPEADACAFCERAKKYELLLVPSDDFGYSGYVRIAYCVKPDRIERSLPAFSALAKEYGLGAP